ncbi:MAG: long-chain-fatty-acid--CoA ligase [Streptosporangiales bacterium]|nr:long-chain-fatty-acid--CoA ligase [Streptosporangiales bacterium]
MPMTARGMTISDQLARNARTGGDQVALTFEGTTRTYREADERVSRLASALRERGVGPGDRVAVLGLNALEVMECYFATARLGAISVPLNFRLVAAEVAYMLEDSGARVAVVQSVLADVLKQAAEKAGGLDAVLEFGGEAGTYERALADASPEFGEVEVDERSAAFIMYTSGTTGRPKGAVLTHRNLLLHTFSLMVHQGVQPDDRVWMAAAPLFHIAGLAAFLPTLQMGGHVVLLPTGGFDPAATVDLMERERVSSVFMVPAQWQAVCALPGIADRDLSALRRISWGAAPATTTLLRTMAETFPQAEMNTVFGQTECSPVTTVLRGEDAIRKIGSVGTPMVNVEVRVVDDEDNDVAPGEVGEIVYRGPMVMREYWNKPAETAEAFRGGWFHSGDLVRQDDEGFFYVVDRKKDMLISGGENIYCAEVEDALASHPAVADVSVIGMPDGKWGEVPLAVIVAADPASPPSAADIESWASERLARYKVPRRLAVVEALPRNPSGKVLKTELRADRDAGRLEIRS